MLFTLGWIYIHQKYSINPHHCFCILLPTYLPYLQVWIYDLNINKGNVVNVYFLVSIFVKPSWIMAQTRDTFNNIVDECLMAIKLTKTLILLTKSFSYKT